MMITIEKNRIEKIEQIRVEKNSIEGIQPSSEIKIYSKTTNILTKSEFTKQILKTNYSNITYMTKQNY